jgi:hypothetical protein
MADIIDTTLNFTINIIVEGTATVTRVDLTVTDINGTHSDFIDATKTSLNLLSGSSITFDTATVDITNATDNFRVVIADNNPGAGNPFPTTGIIADTGLVALGVGAGQVISFGANSFSPVGGESLFAIAGHEEA